MYVCVCDKENEKEREMEREKRKKKGFIGLKPNHYTPLLRHEPGTYLLIDH